MMSSSEDTAKPPAPNSRGSCSAPTITLPPQHNGNPFLSPSTPTTSPVLERLFDTSTPMQASQSNQPGLQPSQQKATFPGQASPTPTCPSIALFPLKLHKSTSNKRSRASAPPRPQIQAGQQKRHPQCKNQPAGCLKVKRSLCNNRAHQKNIYQRHWLFHRPLLQT